jgi:hypothetical protein
MQNIIALDMRAHDTSRTGRMRARESSWRSLEALINICHSYNGAMSLQTFGSRTKIMLSIIEPGFKILEIGTFVGDFVDFLSKIENVGDIHSVDHFEGELESTDPDGNSILIAQGNEVFRSVWGRFRHKNVKIHKKHSPQALEGFVDDYFDIIYIDGDMSYDAVLADLEAALRKVKDGGWICGRPYAVNEQRSPGLDIEPHVRGTVDAFCKAHNQSVSLLGKDGLVSYGIQLKKGPDPERSTQRPLQTSRPRPTKPKPEPPQILDAVPSIAS